MTNIAKIDIEEIVDIDNSKLHKNDEYEIKYWGYSRSLSELLEMYIEKEIIIPSLQRDYIWKHKEASLLIDSILRGLPLPSIFLTEIGSKYVLIDGLQRLHTVYLFIKGKAYKNWNINSGEFVLIKSNDIGQKWRGKNFSNLTIDQQKKIKRTMVNIIEFTQISPVKNFTAMFQIFERINSTGRGLTQQEVRNAAFFSNFNKMLNSLNKKESWKSIFKSEDPRMADIELILRFLTIKEVYFTNKEIKYPSTISLKNAMNEYMAGYQAKELYGNISQEGFSYFFSKFDSINNIDTSIKLDEDLFSSTFSWISENFGDEWYKRVEVEEDGSVRLINRVHPTIFEGLTIAVAFIIQKNIKFLDVSDWMEIRNRALNSCDFEDLFVRNTMSRKNVVARVNLFVKMLTGQDLNA